MKALSIALLLLASSIVAHSQSPIRKINFKNFTYPAYCLGDRPDNITVKNGEYSKETQEDGYVDRFYFSVTDVTYGDVNGDKVEDAIILTNCNTGGTGQFSEGFVYGMRAGKASLLAHIPGGDRGYGGLHAARAEGGMLVVESNDAGETGAACCPEFRITTTYKVAAGKLQKISEKKTPVEEQAERINFDRGKSSTILKASVGGSDSQKFVVGARAGQTLSVSIDRDSATVRLLTAARVTEGVRKFTAVLPKSGDYVFEVLNESATGDEITVTVKIQ
jgi:hypothetical protein